MATGHARKRVFEAGELSYQIIVESEADPITGKRNRKYKTVHGTKKQAEALKRQMLASVGKRGTGRYRVRPRGLLFGLFSATQIITIFA